jgi:hypothetical protein
MSKRIYFKKGEYPTCLYEEMDNNVKIAHPSIRYHNQYLKDAYGAKIKKGLLCQRFYIQFYKDEDIVAFKLKFGY